MVKREPRGSAGTMLQTGINEYVFGCNVFR